MSLPNNPPIPLIDLALQMDNEFIMDDTASDTSIDDVDSVNELLTSVCKPYWTLRNPTEIDFLSTQEMESLGMPTNGDCDLYANIDYTVL